MTEPKRVLSTDEVLYRLGNLSQEFTTAASKAARQAETLSLAAQVVRAERDKTMELHRENQKLQSRVNELQKDAAKQNDLLAAAAKGFPAVPVIVKKPAKELVMTAAASGDLELTRSVIGKGFDVNERNYSGTTALMQAASTGYVEIARLLINSGADTEAKNLWGKTALDIAKISNHPEVVQLLEEAAAKPKLTVLIDGSGSMAGGAYQSGAKSPLQTSLDAVLDLSASGTKVSTLLWGERNLSPVEVTKAAFEKMAKGLQCGTDFMPVVDYMKKATTEKPQNFVVLSDGDMVPGKDMLLKTLLLLSSNPRTTLDFVVISKQKDTLMEKFAKTLSKEFPNQVRFASADCETGVTNLLHNIAVRTGNSQKSMKLPGYQSVKIVPPQP